MKLLKKLIKTAAGEPLKQNQLKQHHITCSIFLG